MKTKVEKLKTFHDAKVFYDRWFLLVGGKYLSVKHALFVREWFNMIRQLLSCIFIVLYLISVVVAILLYADLIYHELLTALMRVE